MSLYLASIDKLHTYMKYLIVGLGNIGREYEATRHNIGFRIADALAARLTIDHILVLVDDLALPFGTLRLKGKGSDAGHNGLKNIAQLLGSQAYPRLRFGIGNDYPQGKQIDYVLGSFHPEEEARLPQLIEYACEATAAFCLEGITSAMNKYNSAAPTDL